ncbi:MAG TPA: hypothetical protein VGD14_02755 [bacterium]
MSLIIKDEDNQLNLYDFGLNPAWLVMDQRQSWLRPFFATDVNWGNFKRNYDPQTSIDANAFFEGVKVMDENQAFRGMVDYHNLYLNDVDQAISRDPYQEHPFRLADNTTGSIHYWGPIVAAQYSRNIWQEKLFFGASLDYQIETGLKDYFPQSRTIYRHIGVGTGVGYAVSNRLSLGVTFNYTTIQEFTEAVPPSANDPRSVEVMKFRGETIGSERTGSMERFTKTKMYRGGIQAHYQPSEFVESAVSIYYNFQNLDATESRSKPVKDGTWKLQGYEIHWKNRVRLPQLPFVAGFSFDRIYFNDWAIHPNFAVVMGDDYLTENRIGAGLAYEPKSFPIILGVEYHLAFAEKDKKDYVSRLTGSGNIDEGDLKIGAEIGVTKTWKIRGGFIHQNFYTDISLLSFSEYQPENQINLLTFGFGWLLKSIEVEGYGYYGRGKPTENPTGVKRDRFGFVVATKFYRN